MLRKFIPNFFTLLNLLSGCIAVVLALQNHLVFAAIFVAIGIFFDFFDGFFARLLKVSSDLGLQLDSLADMVTSGVVPGIVMMQLLTNSLGTTSSTINLSWETQPIFNLGFPLLAFFGLLITLASGYRLAKFNIDTRQTSSFIGLPTPANAILILSLPLILTYQNSDLMASIISNKWFLIVLTLISSFLLNAELPLFGLKFKSWDFKSNWFRYIFLIFCVVTLLTLKFIALPIIIIVYVLLSITLNQQKRSRIA